MPAEGAILSLLVGGEGTVQQDISEDLEVPSIEGIGTNNKIGEITEALRSSISGFDEDVGKRVERLAEETDSDGLREVASGWDSVAEDIDGYEVRFEEEEAVVDWLVGEITDVGVELEEQEAKKLREAVAEEYAGAVETFRDHVKDDKDLDRALRMSTRTDAVSRLEGIADCFRKIYARRPYALHELPEGDGVLPRHEDTFEDPEIAAEHYERAIEENPEDAEAHNNYAVLLHAELDEPEGAAEHYQKAIETYPRLAEAQYNYGVLLLNDGRTEEAKDHLEKAARLWTSRKEFQDALPALRRLVEACLETKDEDAVVEYSESALKFLNSVPEHAEVDEERRWFGTVRMLTRPDDVNTQDLHGSALLNVETGKTEEAVELLETAWERHERHDEESQIGEYRASVAAGVALAAYLETHDDLETSWTAEEILTRIEAEDLHKAPGMVYDHIAGTGDSSGSSEDLRRLSTEYEEEDQSLAATEAGAFALLLERLEASA